MGEFYNPDKLYKGGSRNNSLINKKMIFRVLGYYFLLNLLCSCFVRLFPYVTVSKIINIFYIPFF